MPISTRVNKVEHSEDIYFYFHAHRKIHVYIFKNVIPLFASPGPDQYKCIGENLAFYSSMIRRIIPVEDVLTTLSPMQAEDMLGDNRYCTSDSPGKNLII